MNFTKPLKPNSRRKIVDSTDKNKSAFKSWLAWYSSPPENWNEKYGDAFVWTAQEKALLQQLKEKNK